MTGVQFDWNHTMITTEKSTTARQDTDLFLKGMLQTELDDTESY